MSLHKIHTFVLALLLLVAGAGQASALTWNSSQDNNTVTKGGAVTKTNKINTNYWHMIKCNDYYVYCDNGTFKATKTLPTSTLAADWKKFFFTFTGNTQTTLYNALGYYMTFEGSGTPTSNSSWGQDYIVSDGLTIRASGWATYYHITKQGAFSSNWLSSAANWSFYPMTLSAPLNNYTLRWQINGTIPTGYSAGATINGTHYTSATTSINVATTLTQAMCQVDDVPGFNESIVLSGNTITITYNEKTTPALTVNDLSLVVGGSGRVTVNTNSDAAVTYSVTSGATLIDFDGTTVRAKGAGTAVIRFAVTETATYKAATVNSTVSISLNRSDLSFGVSTIELPIGGTATHTATTSSGSTGGITYRSSAPTIVTVAGDGTVTALRTGTAVITATLAETAQYAGATASYTVNVVRKAATLSFPHLSNNSLSLMFGLEVNAGDTYNNAATTNSDATISYESSNNEVVTVDAAGVLTFVGPGSAVVTARVAQTATYQAAELSCYIYLNSLNYYQLNIVGAPAHGVVVNIAGRNYTTSTLFTLSSVITTSQISVNPISCYDVDVNLELKNNNSESNPHVITVTYTLIPPQTHRFIRVKSYKKSNYLSSEKSIVAGHVNELATTATADLSTVIYYDDTQRFLFYKNGQFATAAAGLNPVGDNSAGTFSFSTAEAVNNGAFAIKSGATFLRDGAGYVESESASINGASDWLVEVMNTLPVILSPAGYGYATFYCPVAVQIPGGISAYVISQRESSSADDRDYTLSLTRLVGSIPAYTPVVLLGMPGVVYDFPLLYDNTESPAATLPGFTGTVESLLTASQEASGTVYTLQPTKGAESVGFYPWQSSVSTGNYPQTVIQGFRAYIVSTGLGIDSYRLGMEDDEESYGTGLYQMHDNAESEGVFTISGQRVMNVSEGLAPGLYIIDGRKVLVR